MEYRAKYRFAKMSARKVREVLDLIRGKHVEDAMMILRQVNKRAAVMVDKTLRSAIANADESLEADMDNLIVKEAVADEGATRKRYRPRARGRATIERRRSSHITIVVDDQT